MSYFLESSVREVKEQTGKEGTSLQWIQLGAQIHKSCLFVFVALLVQGATTFSSGQASFEDQDPDPPVLEVFLLTVGPGDAIWEKFGHNALVFQDSRDGTMMAYNWGIFDFRQHDFIMRLAKGRMRYSMRGFPALGLIEGYRNQDRTVWSQKLNLTPDQKFELLALVRQMDSESNRYYQYDYYRDNCSTRIRDALDSVLGGGISIVTKEQEAGNTYRWHTSRLLQSDMLAYLGIQFVVGNSGDMPISIWEEMFLPLLLKEHLQSVSNQSISGEDISILAPPEILAESSEVLQEVGRSSFLTRMLLLGSILGVVLLLSGWGASEGFIQARWILIGLGASWSMVTGILGALLLLSWFLTDHVFWTLNENIFQANPSSLVLAIILLMSLRKKEYPSVTKMAGIVAALAILGLIVQVLPGFDQANGEIIALAFPIHLGLYLGVTWWGSGKTK